MLNNLLVLIRDGKKPS